MYKIIPIIVLILFSCSPTRHWEKVAADPDVTPRKKAIVADKMAQLFPVVTEYIPGEVITRVDTLSDLAALAELSAIADSLQRLQHPITAAQVDSIIKARKADCKTVTIIKKIYSVDTLKVPDPRGQYALQRRLDIATTTNTELETKLKIEQEKVTAAKGRNKNLWIIIIALGVALLLSWYFSLKGKIKPWNLLSRS